MAAGMAVGSLVISPIPTQVLLGIGLLLGLGGLLSFLHLGRKRNAWRSVMHLKKSWLSREILLTGLFGIAWLVAAGSQWLGRYNPVPWLMAALGVGLVYCMGRVYLLRAVPAWNSWRTPLGFFLSAAVLGPLGMNLLMPASGWVVTAGIAMAAELGLALSERKTSMALSGWLRIGLLVLASLGSLIVIFTPALPGFWQGITLLLVALGSEIIGRWRFYAQRKPFPI
jgi:DMSO reductase anchor subunit